MDSYREDPKEESDLTSFDPEKEKIWKKMKISAGLFLRKTK